MNHASARPWRKSWAAALAFAGLLASFSGTAAAQSGMEGVWVVRDGKTMMNGKELFPGKITGQRSIEVSTDRAGKVTVRPPEFTPEMLALGYEPFDPGFEGTLQGGVAAGTGAYWQVPFWTVNANTECPRPAGLQLQSKHVLEFISAVPLRENCGWTFTEFSQYAGVQYVVMILEPVYLVREVRYIDQDQNPGALITKAAQDQKFTIEIEFEVPPPAPVYVKLGRAATQRVVVRPTGNATVFSSEVVTLAGLKGRQ